MRRFAYTRTFAPRMLQRRNVRTRRASRNPAGTHAGGWLSLNDSIARHVPPKDLPKPPGCDDVYRELQYLPKGSRQMSASDRPHEPEANAPANAPEIKLTILIHRDGPAYIAQCLEHDVAAQGNSSDDCKVRFVKTLRSQIAADLAKGLFPLSELDPAPPKFWERAVLSHASSPELPVYVPAKSHVRATARFLTQGSESVAP